MGCEDFKCDRNYVHFLNANLREYREYRNTRDFVPSPWLHFTAVIIGG